MEVLQNTKQVLKGGQFLVKESVAHEVFTPEDFNEDQQMFADMAREFVEKRVLPNNIKIDKQVEGLVPQLLEEAGELGILGAAIPEEYGGIEAELNTEVILTDVLGVANSFSVAVSAHTGIGTLPVLYFGTEAQKQKYLPGLADGTIKAAYCLTEPGSGSDALAARTKATLTEDGKHYILEGQKMWITNAGFADLFTVFAKIDGKHFTGFLVEAETENLRLGAEEDKLGIKGSSTRQVFLEGVKVPVENLLGAIGEGHKIAFNVLNIGRYKLSVAVNGGAKGVTTVAIKYANERSQFGQSIANFGAIKHKLAEQTIKCFVTDAANYRTSNLMQEMIEGLVTNQGVDKVQAKLLAAEEYAIECALLKVLGSETLDYCADENVQIHGGNGFSEEYTAAKAYRDARINRIFEGTNEINRLLIVGQLMRRAKGGSVDLLTAAMNVQKELMSGKAAKVKIQEGVLETEKQAIRNAKKSVLMTLGAAAQKLKSQLTHEQEIVMNISDMVIDVFAAESALLRVEKMVDMRGVDTCEEQIAIAKVFTQDAMERIRSNGKRAICGFAEGNELKMMLVGLKRLTSIMPFNTIAARRKIAEKLIEANEYCF
ncbi:MAG: acyl-CoA dehydrogenase family protein [Chitinophagales bacterium]